MSRVDTLFCRTHRNGIFKDASPNKKKTPSGSVFGDPDFSVYSFRMAMGDFESESIGLNKMHSW